MENCSHSSVSRKTTRKAHNVPFVMLIESVTAPSLRENVTGGAMDDLGWRANVHCAGRNCATARSGITSSGGESEPFLVSRVLHV